MSLLMLPPELRLQIWSYCVQPTLGLVYPCSRQCDHHDVPIVHDGDYNTVNKSNDPTQPPYKHCDNRLLRVNKQVFAEVYPLVQQTEKDRLFVLCDRRCLDEFFAGLDERDWRWVRRLRLELFVGWGGSVLRGGGGGLVGVDESVDEGTGDNGQDDWFVCQSQRWASRYVAGALSRYGRGRSLVVRLADCVKEDESGRRMLAVDVQLE